jgi:hypothetical protein
MIQMTLNARNMLQTFQRPSEGLPIVLMLHMNIAWQRLVIDYPFWILNAVGHGLCRTWTQGRRPEWCFPLPKDLETRL